MTKRLREQPAWAWADRHAAALSALIAAALFLIEFSKKMREWRGTPEWHAWFDQGMYLKSARAFAAFDFSPDSHLYPPLYSLLAAPFAWLIPNDPFVIINLFCVSATSAMLVVMFGAVIGSSIVAAIFVLGFLVMRGVMFHTFVAPWSSTPATFFIVSALYLLMRTEQSGKVTSKQSILFGLALGLVVPTRPADALVALVLVPFWVFSLCRIFLLESKSKQFTPLLSHLVLSGAAAWVGPLGFFAYNGMVFGRIFSPYVDSQSGLFSVDVLAQRFVSFFFDSSSLFVEPGQTFMARFPWLTLAIFALFVCWRYGANWLRAATTLIPIQFALYFAQVGIFPNGLYRYLNYHYFRWALWLALLLIPAAWVLLRRRYGSDVYKPLGLIIIVAAVMACLQLQTTRQQAVITQTAGRIAISMPPGRRVDFIDVTGLTANWDDTYALDPQPQASLDGRPIKGLTLLRTLPIPTGTRFLFMHPIFGERLEFPQGKWKLASSLEAEIGRYGYALGIPKWLGTRLEILRPGYSLRLDPPMGDHLLAGGYDDERGRALRDRAGVLRLALAPRAIPYQLRLTAVATAPVKVGFRMADATMVTIEADRQEREFVVQIPPAAVSSWRATRIQVRPHWPAAAVAASRQEFTITSMRLE